MIFKTILFTCLAVTIINALPVTKYVDGKSAEIISYSYKPTENGGYSFQFSTSDGQSRQEDAVYHQPSTPEQEAYFTIDGVYSYVGAEGNKYTVVYHADENGYHPVSSNVETAGTF